MHSRKQEGNFLLEMVVVIAIVALLAQLATTYSQQIYAQVATQKEANSIISLLKLARTLSLASQERFTVCYLEDNSCRKTNSVALSLFTDPADTGDLNDDESLIRLFAVAGKDIYVVPVLTRVSFRANGTADAPTSIYVCSQAVPAVGQRVVVSRPGRVRLATDAESDFQERIDRYCGS